MSKWIPVLVRLENLEQVTALLSDLETARGGPDAEANYEVSAVASQSPTLAGPPENEAWSIEQLERLAASPTATGQRWAKALDVCCKEPLTYLPTSEVASRSGMEINEWRDAPRKISRHLKAHFADVPRSADGELAWPLDAGTDPAHPHEVSWAASKTTAERWTQVRDAQA